MLFRSGSEVEGREDNEDEEILSGNVKQGDLVLADYDKKSKGIKITKLDAKKNKQESK